MIFTFYKDKAQSLDNNLKLVTKIIETHYIFMKKF